MDWKEAFRQRHPIVLATVSRENNPHAIYVLSLGFIRGKLLIAVCQMKTTLRNIRNNKKVVFVSSHHNGYYRLEG